MFWGLKLNADQVKAATDGSKEAEILHLSHVCLASKSTGKVSFQLKDGKNAAFTLAVL